MGKRAHPLIPWSRVEVADRFRSTLSSTVLPPNGCRHEGRHESTRRRFLCSPNFLSILWQLDQLPLPRFQLFNPYLSPTLPLNQNDANPTTRPDHATPQAHSSHHPSRHQPLGVPRAGISPMPPSRKRNTARPKFNRRVQKNPIPIRILPKHSTIPRSRLPVRLSRMSFPLGQVGG